jgi:hypothetical protein
MRLTAVPGKLDRCPYEIQRGVCESDIFARMRCYMKMKGLVESEDEGSTSNIVSTLISNFCFFNNAPAQPAFEKHHPADWTFPVAVFPTRQISPTIKARLRNHYRDTNLKTALMVTGVELESIDKSLLPTAVEQVTIQLESTILPQLQQLHRKLIFPTRVGTSLLEGEFTAREIRHVFASERPRTCYVSIFLVQCVDIRSPFLVLISGPKQGPILGPTGDVLISAATKIQWLAQSASAFSCTCSFCTRSFCTRTSLPSQVSIVNLPLSTFLRTPRDLYLDIHYRWKLDALSTLKTLGKRGLRF